MFMMQASITEKLILFFKTQIKSLEGNLKRSTMYFLGTSILICLSLNFQLPEYIPNCLIVFILAIFLLVIPILFTGETLERKLKFYIFVGTFIGGILLGFLPNHIIYYGGVKTPLLSKANVILQSVTSVLNSNLDDHNKKYIINDIISQSKAEVQIEHNGSIYCQQETKRPKQQYILNKIIDEKIIVVGSNSYTFSYSYANEPYFLLGLIRSITFSVLPDLFCDAEIFKNLKLYEYSNASYLNYNIYHRSVAFWIVLIVLYYATFGLAYYKNLINDTNNNLAEIFTYMNYKMMGDIEDITTSKAKNTLQKLIGSWDIRKIHDEEYASFYEASERAARNVRHDLVNKWTDSNPIYTEHKHEIETYVKEILDDLKGVPKSISIEKRYHSIKNILIAIKEIPLISGTGRKERKLVFEYKEHIENSISDDMMCNLNLYRLKSIIANLITNSQYATNNKLVEMRVTDRNYIKKITVETKVTTIDRQEYFTIVVSDNGGGFANVDDIYKKPIVSSKQGIDGKFRTGEGTSYISFFVAYFNGKITARNYKVSEGLMGAETTIFFPIIKK